MGLDCSHNAWHGAYSAFMRWRRMVAQVAGLPPLDLMEGFYQPLTGRGLGVPTLYHGIHTNEPAYGGRPHLAELDDCLPIKWGCLKPSPLHELLSHSDCDGEIPAKRCESIAKALEVLVPLMPESDGGGHIKNWRDKTQQFVDGLRAAAVAGEPLEFR